MHKGGEDRATGEGATVLRLRVNRRRLLAVSAGGGAILAAPGPLRSLLLPPLDPLLDRLLGSAAYATAPDLTARILRPSDQVRLTFEFINLQRNGANLEAINGANPAYMRVIFTSQHTTEPAPASTFVMPNNQMGKVMAADPSRLVFQITPPVPFTVDALLDFANYALALDDRSEPGLPNTNVNTAPSDDVTAIEMPTGLILSPAASSHRFVAETAPVTHNDVTELWRARLGVLDGPDVVEPPDATPTVRAIYNALSFDPFATIPINLTDRTELVKAMAKYSDTVDYPNHEPATIGRLWLSAAGGFLDLAAAWDGGTGNLSAWTHRAATGRDIQVKITARGRLAPFGHKATIVEVSERQFKDDTAGHPAAHLVKTSYLSIAQVTREFPDPDDYMPHKGRNLPFVSVSASTPGKSRATFLTAGPDVAVGQKQIEWTDASGVAQSIDLANAWLVTQFVDGTNDPLLEIQFTAIDRHGQTVEFELPVVFIEEENAFALNTNSPPTKLREYYADSESNGKRTAQLEDQSVGWTNHDASDPGITAGSAKKTEKIRFLLDAPVAGTTIGNLKAADIPAFFPGVERAWVRDETIDTISGAAGLARRAAGGAPPPSTEVTVATKFLNKGTGGTNSGGRYLDLVTPIDLALESNTRSMVQPDVHVEAFSLALGAGGDPPESGATDFDLSTLMLGGAKLLGTFLLSDLLENVTIGNPNSDPSLPRYSVETVQSNGGATNGGVTSGVVDLPEKIIHKFDWKPPLKSLEVPPGSGKFAFVIAGDLREAGLPEAVDGPTEAEIHITQVFPVASDLEPETTIDVVVRDFGVLVPPILPVIGLVFSKLRFLDDNGDESLDLTIEAFTFVGTLEFMNVLDEFLEGVGGDVSIHVDSEGIQATVNIKIPDIAFGIVNVTNINIELFLEIPFDEDPPLTRLSIGKRDNPVGVSVLGIGGSAYFIIAVTPVPENPGSSSIKELELSIAFLMEATASIIIVSVSLRLSIGIILELESNGDTILTGFVCLEGVIKVIGIELLNAGAEASLKYNLNSKIMTGRMEVWIDAGILGEASESVQVEVDLGNNSNGAPVHGLGAPRQGIAVDRLAFGDRYSEDQWKDYCNAFVA